MSTSIMIPETKPILKLIRAMTTSHFPQFLSSFELSFAPVKVGFSASIGGYPREVLRNDWLNQENSVSGDLTNHRISERRIRRQFLLDTAQSRLSLSVDQ